MMLRVVCMPHASNRCLPCLLSVSTPTAQHSELANLRPNQLLLPHLCSRNCCTRVATPCLPLVELCPSHRRTFCRNCFAASDTEAVASAALALQLSLLSCCCCPRARSCWPLYRCRLQLLPCVPHAWATGGVLLLLLIAGRRGWLACAERTDAADTA